MRVFKLFGLIIAILMEAVMFKKYRLLALGLLINSSSLNSGYFTNYSKAHSFAMVSTIYAATSLYNKEIKLEPQAQTHQAIGIIARLKNFLNPYNRIMQWLPGFVQEDNLKKYATRDHPKKSELEQDFKLCQVNQACKCELDRSMVLDLKRCAQDKIFKKENLVYCKALTTGIITDQFRTWTQELEDKRI